MALSLCIVEIILITTVALHAGLVSRVVPADEVDEVVMIIVKLFLKNWNPLLGSNYCQENLFV